MLARRPAPQDDHVVVVTCLNFAHRSLRTSWYCSVSRLRGAASTRGSPWSEPDPGKESQLLRHPPNITLRPGRRGCSRVLRRKSRARSRERRLHRVRHDLGIGAHPHRVLGLGRSKAFRSDDSPVMPRARVHCVQLCGEGAARKVTVQPILNPPGCTLSGECEPVPTPCVPDQIMHSTKSVDVPPNSQSRIG